VHNDSGAKPFGEEYKPTDQIEKYLEKVANGEIDACDDEDGINVIDDVAFDQLLHDLPESKHAEATRRRNAGEKVAAIAKSYDIKPRPRVAPPTKSKMKKSLGDHHDAPRITSMIDHPDGAPGAPRTTQRDQRTQRAIDDLISLLNSPAGKKLPETERRRLSPNLSALLGKDQAAIDAKHGVKESPPDWADLARQEDQRQKRARAVAEHLFARHSGRSNFDGATSDEARESQDRKVRGTPPPGPDYTTPRAPVTPATIQTKRQAAQRAHGSVATDALASLKRAAAERKDDD
jgi:hypothetical protein